jgi:hypothetical protein
MLWLVLGAIGLATGGLVLAVEGLNMLAVWNLVPVVIGLVTSAIGARQSRLSPAARLVLGVFCVAVLTCVALFHLAWRFDWGGTSTGSSTAGLIFIFAPVYCIVVAAVAAGIALVAVGVLSVPRRGA